MSVVERLKRMNLVQFLQRSYGIVFKREGDAHVALSPFREESRPSFCVREERDGHWVFKDHGSGQRGTVFDYVMIREGLGSFGEALGWLCRATGLGPAPVGAGREAVCCAAVPSAPAGSLPVRCTQTGGWKKKEQQAEARENGRRHDVAGLYERLRGEDASVCGEYLLGRGIDESLVGGLLENGTVVLNRFERGTFCCFAVRDASGVLRGLYNRQIDGDDKFVLGKKAPFTLDWVELPQARTVFLCEGPIDYLSIKTLEGRGFPGLALLGNVLNVNAAMLPSCRKLVAAFDGDRGGFSALFDAQEEFSEQCEVHVYELEDQKDPNELLLARRKGQTRELSPERKLALYREFTAAANKAEVIRKWQLSRSYVYEVVRECEAAIVAEFAGRRRGRPSRTESPDPATARERIQQLEEQYESEAAEREKLYCRSEFLALRLKWAEIEAAEARGQTVDPSGQKPPKRHAKKKRRKRR